DARGGRTRAQEHDLRVAEPDAGNPGRGVDAGQRDRGRALDVVVEAQHAIPVFREQRVRVRRQKILELDQRGGISRLYGDDEFLDEIEVGLTGQPPARI